MPVTVACGATDRVTFLAYTVALAGASDGSGERLRVSYLLGGHPGTLVLPVAVRLCATDQAQSMCEPPSLSSGRTPGASRLLTHGRARIVAECGGLENRYGFIAHRGFESHALRSGR